LEIALKYTIKQSKNGTVTHNFLFVPLPYIRPSKNKPLKKVPLKKISPGAYFRSFTVIGLKKKKGKTPLNKAQPIWRHHGERHKQTS